MGEGITEFQRNETNNDSKIGLVTEIGKEVVSMAFHSPLVYVFQ
jgi:hypothetical protein